MKRIVLVMLVVIMILASVLVGCNKNGDIDGSENQAETKPGDQTETKPEDLYEYESTTGGLRITKYLGNEKKITVPNVIENRKVVSIGTAFSGYLSLEEIVLPNNIVEADLSGCNNLVSVKSSGITSGGKLRVSNCPSLKYIELSGITDIDSGLYLTVPDTVETLNLENAKGCLKVYTISGGEGLKNLIIPNVESIAKGYHSWPIKLESVTIAESMKYYSSSEYSKFSSLNCDNTQKPIANEDAATVFCDFFQVDKITVNGTLYEK